MEFDHNSNFVSDDILPDFVTRLKNHGTYNPYRMNFVRNRIINSLME